MYELQKLEHEEKKASGKSAQQQPVLLRTHPLTSDRVEDCRNRVAEMRDVLEASSCDAELMSRLSSLRMHGKNAWNPFYRPSI